MNRPPSNPFALDDDSDVESSADILLNTNPVHDKDYYNSKKSAQNLPQLNFEHELEHEQDHGDNADTAMKTAASVHRTGDDPNPFRSQRNSSQDDLYAYGFNASDNESNLSEERSHQVYDDTDSQLYESPDQYYMESNSIYNSYNDGEYENDTQTEFYHYNNNLKPENGYPVNQQTLPIPSPSRSFQSLDQNNEPYMGYAAGQNIYSAPQVIQMPLQQPLYMGSPFNYPPDIFHPYEQDVDEPDLQQDIDVVSNEEIEDQNIAEKGDDRVQLLNGKYYSVDYPVPNQIVESIRFKGASANKEFTHLRYHAITTDPKNYSVNASNPNFRSEETRYIEEYPLRQKAYTNKRDTELMIVCTMYNEDEVLLARTLKGVFNNIKTMFNMKNDENNNPFGSNTWKSVVVVIVSDGRSKINERAKSLLTLLGVFQEGVMQEYVNDDKVNAHLFEYTTSFGIDKFRYNRATESHEVHLVTEKTVPVQLMFLLKEENKQKINSHRWALNFLCPNLNPKVVVLLDVGTEPGPDSIYKLWNAFKNPDVGGACGEIRALLGEHASPNDSGSIFTKAGRFFYFQILDFFKCLINPLIAAQNFEYKMSNILDKPMESAFGFVSVLPGAFSAYRYEALKGAPLEAYFHGEDMKSNFDKPAGILESNMYLAEDRILCFELVVKSAKSYLLKYVHDSYAVTDVPSTINEFINQRRRWLNGSFFAALYSILHFYRLLKSTHSPLRILVLVIEVVYQVVTILLSWFSLSVYFLVFRILTMDMGDTFIGERVADILSIVFLWIYIAAMILTFILSFGNKPNDSVYMYLLAFFLFSAIVTYMTFCVVCLTIESIKQIEDDIGVSNSAISTALKYFKNAKFRDLTISLSSTYVLYIVSSLLFFDMFHIFACTLQYLLLSPAYINVLGIYAFCNMNDISWGTKGSLTNDIKVNVKKAKEDTTNKDVDEEDDEKNVLLSEKMADPDELYLKAQNCINGKSNAKSHEPTEEDLLKLENEKIEKNIKATEKNYALGRTYTVLLWLATNFILLVVILKTGGLGTYSKYKNGTTTTTYTLSKRNYWQDLNVANTFMAVILWLVAFLSLFRFLGCFYYRVSFSIEKRRFHNKQVHT